MTKGTNWYSWRQQEKDKLEYRLRRVAGLREEYTLAHSFCPWVTYGFIYAYHTVAGGGGVAKRRVRASNILVQVYFTLGEILGRDPRL